VASALDRQDGCIAGLDDLLGDTAEDDSPGATPGAGAHDREVGPDLCRVLRDDPGGASELDGDGRVHALGGVLLDELFGCCRPLALPAVEFLFVAPGGSEPAGEFDD
jgi:hypothetical protein